MYFFYLCCFLFVFVAFRFGGVRVYKQTKGKEKKGAVGMAGMPKEDLTTVTVPLRNTLKPLVPFSGSSIANININGESSVDSNGSSSASTSVKNVTIKRSKSMPKSRRTSFRGHECNPS